MALVICPECGKQVSTNASSCPHCGTPLNLDPNRSDREWLVTLLLCFFLGTLGIHSFYARKNVVGVVQLFTLGGCGIWALVDFIMILCGSYKDGNGKLIANR